MTVQEFTSKLFELQVITHIAHLQTTSYAQHKALNEVYDAIVSLSDRFIESYQGKFGIITGYKSFTIREGFDMVTYLKSCALQYANYGDSLTDSYLKAIIDDIVELLYSSIYKLKSFK